MLEDQLLDFLRQNQSGFLSGNELSRKLGISRTAIWKHMEQLRALGYEIEAQPHMGYRLVSVPDRLIPAEIRLGLGTRWMGKKIVSYEETGSTNDVAGALAGQGTEEGTIVFAESQTHGRGRLGRSWISQKGAGILMSVILRPKLLPSQASQITLMAAVATAKAIEKTTAVSVQIKWPNDLLVSGRKAGGILTEMQAETDQIRSLVLGIGINVSVSLELLPEGATSLNAENPPRKFSRILLAQELLRQLEADYERLNQGEWEAIQQEWQERSVLSGKHVRVQCQARQIEGTVAGLDPDGALLVRLDHGFTERVVAGDVVAVR